MFKFFTTTALVLTLAVFTLPASHSNPGTAKAVTQVQPGHDLLANRTLAATNLAPLRAGR